MRRWGYAAADLHPDYRRHARWPRTSETRWLRRVHRLHPTAKDFRVSLHDAFLMAATEIPSIDSQRSILGGTPRMRGTRIPVYMILDAIEYCGNLEGALKSYPDLNLQQVKDAVRFAKLLVEWPVDDNETAASS